MLGKLLSKYSSVLGLVKLWCYKIILGKRLSLKGTQSFSHRARLRIREGGKIEMNPHSYAGDGTLIRVTQNATFKMGKNSGFNSYCIVTAQDSITLGDNVIIGPFVTMHDHDHAFGDGVTMKTSGYVTAPIVIEDNVWIGGNVTILKGVRIGTGSVIAAGTIVSKDIPPHSIVYDKRDKVTKVIENK